MQNTGDGLGSFAYIQSIDYFSCEFIYTIWTLDIVNRSWKPQGHLKSLWYVLYLNVSWPLVCWSSLSVTHLIKVFFHCFVQWLSSRKCTCVSPKLTLSLNATKYNGKCPQPLCSMLTGFVQPQCRKEACSVWPGPFMHIISWRLSLDLACGTYVSSTGD